MVWIKKDCFEATESSAVPGKFMISPIHANFHLTYTTGSYNIICARLMNLTYAQWLRFCRDCCGAEIIGRGTMYPIAVFPNGRLLYQLIRLLNGRANMVLWEREHPNWRDHQDQLLEREKIKEERENVPNS